MLHVHRSERADYLVEALGDLLLDALEDPMAEEVIAVPTRGVERWLTQRLSHRLGVAATGEEGSADGVCANVDFPFPGGLIGTATSIACGFDPDTDPWPPDRSVWPLLELVDEHLTDSWLAPLASHLRAGTPEDSLGAQNGQRGEGGSPPLRRFATVRHLADLFDRYAVHRPDMVQAWADGAGRDDGWQAELWRRLRARIGVPSPAERLQIAAETLVAAPELLDLPSRLSLFGLTRLPASHLRILEAIAAHRDVHLFLLYPSGALWDRVAEAATGVEYPMSRRHDPTAELAENPLLRSWGRDAREMQLVLDSHGVAGGEHRPVPAPPGQAQALLQLLQADIRADRQPPGAPRPHTKEDARPRLGPHDDSLRVHACHGRLRQVEVMRDAILHLLADDATLEPRDVIVMCPDIESFAPLIHAVFGAGTQQPSWDGFNDGDLEPGPPQVRVRLADRSIRQTNPVLAVAAQLLDLASGRVTASEVLDLAAREPVSRRFRFDEDDLGQLERWVAETGIRWGLDREHRAPWKLERVAANTWDAGFDRLLLGVAMAEEDERLFAEVLPLDDVSSSAVDLAGRFAEFVERLHAAVDSLQGRHSVAQWALSLAGATESLAVAAPHELWQHDQLHRVLDDVATAGGEEVASPSPLDLAEVRSLLDDRLRGRPTRANFRTGDLTICTLVPMRSVPHRVVGLLGLDDGAFPRHTAQDGDDLLLADPRVGDRDSRSEDRQLLLDAVLAATEHLVITYEGRDPRTNQERSPCVPIAELLDVVDRTVRTGDTQPERARDRVVVQHPLQSFDQRNLSEGALLPETVWSFDPVDLDGARAVADLPEEPRPFLGVRLPRADSPVIQLDLLVRFLEHPVRAFLRERLGWYGTGGADEVKDGLPVELDGLEQWGVGDRMLGARLAGASPAQAAAAERGRGLLPPGVLAGVELQDIEDAVETLAAAAGTAIPDRSETGSMEVNVRLPDGRLLIGTVPDVYGANSSDDEYRIVRCIYSRLAPKHRIAAWARFLALTAAHPERSVAAATVGRGQGKSQGRPRIAIARLAPFGGSEEDRRSAALSNLAVLVDLYDRGLIEPLPLYTATSEKFAALLLEDGDAVSDSRKVWESSMFSHGEDSDPEHLLVLGGQIRFEGLLRDRPRGDEAGEGWPNEKSRFGRLARRMWQPLLLHEHVEYRS